MAYKDQAYIERRVKELNTMSTEEIARRKIRATTPERIRKIILKARQEQREGGGSQGKNEKKQADAAAIKKKLKDGDVLLMRKHNTFMQNVIAGVTGSPYTHAAIYKNGKVYDTLNIPGNGKSKCGKKSNGGNVNTVEGFMDRDRGIQYDVFRPNDEKAATEASRNIERITKETTGYSNANAVQAGMRDRLGFGFTTNYSKNYRICSELVHDAFNGKIGSDAGSSVSPGRLAKNKHLEKVDSLKLSLDTLNEFFDDVKRK